MDALWRINADVEQVLENGITEEAIDKETGEIDYAKVAEQFDSLMCDRKEKIKNITYFIKNTENLIADMKKAEDDIKARRSAKENAVERLKNYLIYNLKQFGDKKIEDVDFSLLVGVSRGVEITDEQSIPEEYKVVKTEYKPDKMKIKAALQEGKEVSGARLYEKDKITIK